MNPTHQLTNTTMNYLNQFHCILNNMIRGMTGACLGCSISHNFIVQMIPHHRAAIEMSWNILNYTTDLSLQQIASRIITEQTQSIADMEEILYCCGTFCNCCQDLSAYENQMHQIMQTMFAEMSAAPSTNNINADFMREMIPHHEGAIRMSKTTLQYCICPELKPILTAIITSQERGVAQMKELLRFFDT